MHIIKDDIVFLRLIELQQRLSKLQHPNSGPPTSKLLSDVLKETIVCLEELGSIRAAEVSKHIDKNGGACVCRFVEKPGNHMIFIAAPDKKSIRENARYKSQI
jgi:hypothetical protein